MDPPWIDGPPDWYFDMPNTDDAPADVVLRTVAHCASGWEGDVRLLGNVRAKDIGRAIRETAAELEDLRKQLAELNDGSRVILPKSLAHAEAMHLVAEAGFKSFKTL